VDAYNCQLRVLVVEANPLRRTTLINKLRHQFSAVFAAEGEGEVLLAEAARLVREAPGVVRVEEHHRHVPGQPRPAAQPGALRRRARITFDAVRAAADDKNA